MLPEELRKLFKRLMELSDTKEYDEQPLDRYLEELWDKASAKEKVQNANLDLTKQRDEWKLKEKEYKSQLSEFEQLKTAWEEEKKALSGSQLTEEQKKLLNKGMSAEIEAVMNTLKKTVEEQGQKMGELQKAVSEAAEQKKSAQLRADQEALNTQLTQALMSNKIKDSSQIKAALALINAGGMAKIERNEDGEIKHIFSYTENGKPYAFENVEALAKHVAENNPYLVSASGKPGAGQSYKPSSGEPTQFTPTNLQQARQQASAQFMKVFERD